MAVNRKQGLLALVAIAIGGVIIAYNPKPVPIAPEAEIDGHRFMMQRQGRDKMHEYALTVAPGGPIANPESLMQAHADQFCTHGLVPVLKSGWLKLWEQGNAADTLFSTVYRCKPIQQHRDMDRQNIWNTDPFDPLPEPLR